MWDTGHVVYFNCQCSLCNMGMIIPVSQLLLVLNEISEGRDRAWKIYARSPQGTGSSLLRHSQQCGSTKMEILPLTCSFEPPSPKSLCSHFLSVSLFLALPLGDLLTQVGLIFDSLPNPTLALLRNEDSLFPIKSAKGSFFC